jgi:hypothetical protein
MKRNNPLLIMKTFIKSLNNLNNLNLKINWNMSQILVKLEILFLFMVNSVTTLVGSWNKNLNDQHHFLLFKVTNIVAQFANNNPNQLQTKVNTRKQGKWKQIPTYKSYNKKLISKWNDSNSILKGGWLLRTLPLSSSIYWTNQ